MKEYRTGKKIIMLTLALGVIFSLGMLFGIYVKSLKIIFSSLFCVLFSLISCFIFSKAKIILDDEQISMSTGSRIGSMRYSEIAQVTHDEFLGVFSVVYLLYKAKMWGRGLAIHSSIKNYKDCLREIISRVPPTTWIDPELLKFLSAKPKPLKEQFKRIGYVMMVGAAIFLVIMIVAVIATRFNIRFE